MLSTHSLLQAATSPVDTLSNRASSHSASKSKGLEQSGLVRDCSTGKWARPGLHDVTNDGYCGSCHQQIVGAGSVEILEKTVIFALCQKLQRLQIRQNKVQEHSCMKEMEMNRQT
jgi:hypothetical protein